MFNDLSADNSKSMSSIVIFLMLKFKSNLKTFLSFNGSVGFTFCLSDFKVKPSVFKQGAHHVYQNA